MNNLVRNEPILLIFNTQNLDEMSKFEEIVLSLSQKSAIKFGTFFQT